MFLKLYLKKITKLENHMKKIIIIILGLLITIVTYTTIENSRIQDKFGILKDACRAKPVINAHPYVNKTGLHPVMSVIKSSTGFTIYTYATPDDVLAKSIEDTELVLCLNEAKKVLINSCAYTTKKEGRIVTNIVERYRFEQKVLLVEAKTAKVLAQNILKGEEPRKCLKQELFIAGKDTNEVTGKHISDSQIGEWMRPYTNI